jgi:4-diphosphocytidyl-2-C-methyl-D-erythritol kinase
VLTTRAPGKVNVCLLVGAPRPDGLHPLVSIFQPVSLADEVTLSVGAHSDAVICPGVEGENLAVRALAEFRAATGWDGAPQTLTIAKHVPVAAGMGGGSADAAAALRLAAAASGLPIPPDLPMRLGADVPVLLDPQRALVTGAGENVEPLSLAPSAALVIVPLDAELSTAAVYREFDAHDRPRSSEELEEAATALRTGGVIPIVNDLEAAAMRLCSAIEPALEALRQAGVRDPMVTGSGPTVFGYSDDPDAPARLRAAGYPRAVAARPVAGAEVRPA